MNRIFTLFVLCVFLSYLAFAQSAGASVEPPPLQDALQPILDLMGGKGTWLSTILVWMGAISAGLAPFAARIRNLLADALNRAAESSDLDDDFYLRRLFSHPAYRFLAFLLNFLNVRLPSLLELERAIQLQQEAVNKASYMKGLP